MPFGPLFQSDAGRRNIDAAAPKLMDKIARLGMTPRQLRLNHLFSFFRCEHYSTRRVGWDGKEVLDPVAREAIATAGFIPPGFYDAGGQMNELPHKFRKPTAPYHLTRVIVERFTGLLFSERRHPVFRVEGDPDSEDYAAALAEASRLWQRMIQARHYGGAMGSVAVGFQFLNGRPIVEVHDPRWTRPIFSDRSALELEAIDKRYIYPIEARDPETGEWEDVPHWYRRVITDTSDTLWEAVPVEDGEEPNWRDSNLVTRHVEHGLGFCPVVWVQNLPVLDDVDGDPDCQGVYETIEAIDMLLAQANRGVLFNSDPTVHLSTDRPISEIRKGSDNAVHTEKGGSFQYVELTGSGPKMALELVDKLRAYTLEVTQCVLDHPATSAEKTATEIERVYSSMLAKADVMREQYGEQCVKPLMEMMLRAAGQMAEPVQDEEGTLVVRELNQIGRAHV